MKKKSSEFKICSIKLTALNHRGLKVLSARTGKSLIVLSNEAIEMYLRHKDQPTKGDE